MSLTPVNLEILAKDASKAVRRGDVIIIIDVLRCSSTIIAALANGAKGIIPVKTLKEAKAYHQKHLEFILAGERRGLKPEGFDLGNSPLEFSPETIKGRHVILTTTSGTMAISLAKNGRWTLIGALLNAKAVAEAAMKIAEKEQIGISLVLAGKKGRFSLEDFICAGAIVGSLPTEKVKHSDAALAASLAFQQASESISRTVQIGDHAQFLKSVGFGADIKFCCRLDAFGIVPVYKNGVIVPLEHTL